MVAGVFALIFGLTFTSPAAESGAENDFLLRRWSSDEGLAWGDIRSLARTPDGFLWIAADLGLVRFDGYQFEPLSAGQFPVPPNDHAASLLADRQGRLWAGTEQGRLYCGTGSQLKEFTPAPATGGKELSALMEDAQGAIWAATKGAGLWRFQNGGWKAFHRANGLPGEVVSMISCDAGGRVWAVAEGKLVFYDGDRFMAPTNAIPTAQPVTAIAAANDGGLWVSTADHDLVLGQRIFQFKDGVWREPTGPYPWTQASIRSLGGNLLQDAAGRLWATTGGGGVFYWMTGNGWVPLTQAGDLGNARVNTFVADAEGSLWLGVRGGLLYRAHQRAVAMLFPDTGTNPPVVYSTSAGHDGSLWVGTYGGGVFHYQNGEWTHHGRDEGLGSPYVFSLLEDRRTNLWVGVRGGLFHWRDGRFDRVAGMTAGAFLSLFEARDGALWIGSNLGLGRYQAGVMHVFKTADGVPALDILTVAQDSQGRIWAAVRGHGLLRQNGEKFERFVTRSPLDTADIRQLRFDADGALWAATFGEGLFRLRQQQVTQWRIQDGLASDYLLSMIEDDRGGFWFSTVNGIFGCTRAALDNAVLNGRRSLLERHLGVAEGLRQAACSGWGQPVAARTADGRLWFPDQSAVAVFDPAVLAQANYQRPVIIEDVTGDGVVQVADGTGVVRVESGLRRLEFHYTVPDLLSAASLRFRYKLDGLDKEWTDAGSRHLATYTHVPPGHYRFNVMVGRADGAWQASPSPLVVEVLPRWWERASVRALIAAGLVGGLVFGVWTAARARLRRRLQLLEVERAAESERQRIARDLHDNLGSGLTEIALMSDMAQTAVANPSETKTRLNEIFAASRGLARSLDETVWAISRKNETVEKSLVFICKSAQDFLRLAGIPCRLESPDVLPSSYFSSAVRHNLFLATREALNNIVKHAQATEVWLRLDLQPDWLTLVIEDNGSGFAEASGPSAAPGGRPEPARSGLGNLEKRLREIGGRAECRSVPGKGTTVRLIVPLQNENPAQKTA